MVNKTNFSIYILLLCAPLTTYAQSLTIVNPAINGGTQTNPIITSPTITGGVLNGTQIGSATSVANGAGAIARTNTNHISDVVNILDYGADPTGAADSTPAWNKACAVVKANPNGKLVYIPTGNYLEASTWSCTGTQVSVVGDGPFFSVIWAAGPGTALSLAPGSVSLPTHIEGLAFLPTGSSPPTSAISIVYPSVSSYPYETTIIKDVQLLSNGANVNQHFVAGLQLYGLWQSRIQGVGYWAANSLGIATPISGTHGIEIGGSYDVSIDDFRAYSADIGVDQTTFASGQNSYSEAIHLNRPDFVGGNIGFQNQLSSSPINTFSGLDFYMNDAECDVYVNCISLNQYAYGFIHDNRIALRADTAGNSGIDLLDTRQIHVGFNSFQMPTTTANATGLQIRTLAGVGGNGNRADNFSCYSGLSCVTLGTGTTLNVVTNALSVETAGVSGTGTYSTGFSDAGTNNFLQAITSTGYTIYTGVH